MEYINGFWNNLSNRHTTTIIAFFNGFIIGMARFKTKNIFFGLLMGLIFAIAAGLINLFIDIVLPTEINISVNTQALFTILLIMTLISTTTNAVNSY